MAAWALAWALAFAPVSSGAATGAQRLAAVRASSPPLLADPQWTGAAHADGFVNLTLREPARLATSARLLYDDRFVYVRFECVQAGVPIVANQTTNNVGYGVDDNVGVSIDTSGTGAQTYEFYTTPNGTHYQFSAESARFNPRWTSYARRDGANWQAELVIPLASLRGALTTSWRINFRRHVAAENEDFSWAYDTAATSAADSSYWPLLTGLALAGSATRPPPRAAVYGLEAAGGDRDAYADPSGNLRARTQRHLGTDFTYPITNTLAVVGTIAPDFSNVEADQVTVAPQEFARALTEYRPFFSQGAQYMTPKEVNLSISGAPNVTFYSPSVDIINEGVQLEGTAGTAGLGVLQFQGPGVNDIVFGVKQSRANQQFRAWTNGVFANHLGTLDRTVEFGAFDRNARSGLSASFDLAARSGTLVSEPGQAKSAEFGGGITNQRLTAFVLWRDIGPQFAPLDGLTEINDVRGPLAYVQYAGTSAGRTVKSYSISAGADRFVDRTGLNHAPTVHLADVSGGASVTFRNLVSLGLNDLNSQQRIYDRGYPVYAGGVTLPFRQLAYSVGYRDGTASPVDLYVVGGQFGSFYLRQYDLSTQRQVQRHLFVSAEYEVIRENGALHADGQSLRRLTLVDKIGRDFSASLGLRNISGGGGFSAPGTNLVFGLHTRFASGNEFFVDFGSPATTTTLHRAIAKYVIHLGGAEGS